MLQQLLIIIIHPNALSSSSSFVFSQTLPKWLLFQNWVYDVGITTYLTTLWGAKFFRIVWGNFKIWYTYIGTYLLFNSNANPIFNLYINNGNVSVKIISSTHRWSCVVFDSFFKHLHTFQTNIYVVYVPWKVGVKVQNMKMDFSTGGTWRLVGQWTLMMKIYDFFLFG